MFWFKFILSKIWFRLCPFLYKNINGECTLHPPYIIEPNKFKNESNLLYEISSKGERSATLDKSQLPSASSVIFPQVVIMPGKSQTYKIKIWYEGDISKEKESTFFGRLVIKSI